MHNVKMLVISSFIWIISLILSRYMIPYNKENLSRKKEYETFKGKHLHIK